MITAKKIIKYFYLILLVWLALLSFILFIEVRHHDLEFYVFDVGQGDAILIRTPAKQNILIDGGPDNSVVYKLGKYLPFYDRSIDLMILTHPHADHLIGLIEVLKRYKVKNILAVGVDCQQAEYLVWLDLIKEKNINVLIANQPEIFYFSGGIKLIILYPDKSFFNQPVENFNNVSIVAKLIYGQTEIMLTGDFENEEILVNKNLDLAADILKVGHHGSNTANSPLFLRAVSPDWAVISCGEDNKFNHPHGDTVNSLLNLPSDILRTDQSGDVIFFSDGIDIRPVEYQYP